MEISRVVSQIRLVVFIHYVVIYGAFIGAGEISGFVNSHQIELSHNCQILYRQNLRYIILCNSFDTDNATQIKIGNILSMLDFQFTDVIQIQNTMVREFPEIVCRYKQLKWLVLSRNKLTTLSPTDCFAGMDNLEELDLSNNEISYLPDGIFANLSQLTALDLNNNNI